MKTIPIPHLVAAVAFGALAVVALIFVPDERLAKLVTFAGRVIEDPAGALAALSLLAGAITTLRAAWLRQPPSSLPAARPPVAGPSAPDDDDDDTQPPESDGPPTRPRPRRMTTPPSAARVAFDPSERAALNVSTRLLNAWHRETRRRIPRLAALHRAGAIALVSLALVLLAGCGASALRTHQTIATIARVSVVAAHPAIVSACETLMSRCTDDACLERVGHDCEAAAVARDTAHAAVRAYVDTIQIAAHADEGRVAPALDLALSTLARVYDAAREAIARMTGYQLPELPPEALPILRALTAGAVEVLGGGS